jgi:hypothetical protein
MLGHVCVCRASLGVGFVSGSAAIPRFSSGTQDLGTEHHISGFSLNLAPIKVQFVPLAGVFGHSRWKWPTLFNRKHPAPNHARWRLVRFLAQRKSHLLSGSTSRHFSSKCGQMS